MESRLNQLKFDFTAIKDIRTQVISIFDILEHRIDKLQSIYAEFIKISKINLFVFGLDSFHFQSKIIDIEFEDMKRLFLVINNRMYCEYFKLYKIICDYIEGNIVEQKVRESIKRATPFPIYKDLEPFRQYDFDVIEEIHENIIELIGGINGHIMHKEHELKSHQLKQNIGLNIDNFVNTFNYNVSMIREKVNLFISYIEFFHKLHTKYLKRFATKVQLMYSQINNDIKFEDTGKINETKKKDMLASFASENVDKKLLSELRHSIVDEDELSDETFSGNEKSPKNIVEGQIAPKRNVKAIFKSGVKKLINTMKFTKKPEEEKPLPIQVEAENELKNLDFGITNVSLVELKEANNRVKEEEQLTQPEVEEPFCVDMKSEVDINEAQIAPEPQPEPEIDNSAKNDEAHIALIIDSLNKKCDDLMSRVPSNDEIELTQTELTTMEE